MLAARATITCQRGSERSRTRFTPRPANSAQISSRLSQPKDSSTVTRPRSTLAMAHSHRANCHPRVTRSRTGATAITSRYTPMNHSSCTGSTPATGARSGATAPTIAAITTAAATSGRVGVSRRETRERYALGAAPARRRSPTPAITKNSGMICSSQVSQKNWGAASSVVCASPPGSEVHARLWPITTSSRAAPLTASTTRSRPIEAASTESRRLAIVRVYGPNPHARSDMVKLCPK
ncbi:unannotated protein [freshwater metagenome]|uniref:Unannotated protein n=1 Tax=freshwater metagenome TaxID=449393 RepID=A0A6J7PZT9_9ZZZZ